MFRSIASAFLRKETKKGITSFTSKKASLNGGSKCAFALAASFGLYSYWKSYNINEKIKCEETLGDGLDLLPEIINKNIDEVIQERKSLDNLLEEINTHFKNIDSRIGNEISLEKINDDFLTDFDLEWLELSKKVHIFTSKLDSFTQKCQSIDKNLPYIPAQPETMKLAEYEKSKIDISGFPIEKYKSIMTLKSTINEIFKNLQSEIPEELNNESLDPNTLLYYFYKKNKILQTLRIKELMPVFKKYCEESDEELNLLTNLYRQKIAKLEKHFNEPISDKLNEMMTKFVREHTASFYQQMIAALNQQRNDLEAIYTQKEDIFKSKFLTDVETEYQPVISSVESLKTLIKHNNSLIDEIEKRNRSIYLSNRVILALNQNRARSEPIGRYLSEISENSDHENIKLIVDKIPISAKEGGIYDQHYLIDQLPELIKESKKLVFSKNDELTPKLKTISTFHSILRFKNPFLMQEKFAIKDEIMEVYDVLDSMDIHVKNKDIINCIKSVFSLSGNSRHVFDDWISKATDSVETKLLSEVLNVALNNQKLSAK